MAKVGTLVPSQIRGLRLKSGTPRQPDLAKAAGMHQSRISALETAGNNPTISTLSEVAAALNVGLKIEFVSFSEMLEWESGFSQDKFNAVRLDKDKAFLNPAPVKSVQHNVSVLGSAAILRLEQAFMRQFSFSFDRASAGSDAAALQVQTNVEAKQFYTELVHPLGKINSIDMTPQDVPISLLFAQSGNQTYEGTITGAEYGR